MSKLTLSVSKLSDEHKKNLDLLKKRARIEERITIIEELERYFPKCFNFDSPLPLKVGIEFDVIKHLPKEAPISRKKLQRAIKYYVSNIKYRKRLIKGNFRHDLEGRPASYIDPQHKQSASQWLSEVRSIARKY